MEMQGPCSKMVSEFRMVIQLVNQPQGSLSTDTCMTAQAAGWINVLGLTQQTAANGGLKQQKLIPALPPSEGQKSAIKVLAEPCSL